MNLHDLQQIYAAAQELYLKDNSLTDIQINLSFKDPVHQKKIGLINVDFKDPTRQLIKHKSLEKNPYCKPQILEKNERYSF